MNSAHWLHPVRLIESANKIIIGNKSGWNFQPLLFI